MLMLPRSKLKHDSPLEAEKIIKIYKEGNKHDSLYNYLGHLLNTGAYVDGGRMLVYTYSNVLFNI